MVTKVEFDYPINLLHSVDPCRANLEKNMQSNNQPSSQQDSIEQVNGKPNDFEFTIDPNEPVDQVLERFKEHLKERTKHHFGYPYNLKFDHTKLAPFYQFCINNLGDPFVPSNYGVHARAFERDVLDYFADLWKIPTNEYWGNYFCIRKITFQKVILQIVVLKEICMEFYWEERFYLMEFFMHQENHIILFLKLQDIIECLQFQLVH